MKGKLPNLFYGASVTLILKPEEKKIHKKGELQTNIPGEHDVKILSRIVANQIQKYIKIIIHHDQVVFIPGLQGWFNIHKSINVIHHINKKRVRSI